MRGREREHEGIQQTVYCKGDAREALTGGLKRSRDRIHSARDTAEQEERSQQIASVIENLSPFAEAMTQRSWRTDQTERTAFSFIVSRTRCCKLPLRGARALTAKQPSRSGLTLSSGVGGDRSEPRSRELHQNDAGGSREGTTAKEPLVRRRRSARAKPTAGKRKEATQVPGPREEHRRSGGRWERFKV